MLQQLSILGDTEVEPRPRALEESAADRLASKNLNEEEPPTGQPSQTAVATALSRVPSTEHLLLHSRLKRSGQPGCRTSRPVGVQPDAYGQVS